MLSMKPSAPVLTLLAIGLVASGSAAQLTYPVVGTGQEQCFDNFHMIPAPQPGEPFYGQDAQHPGNTPAYHANGDGTVSDRVTGLIWVQARGEKMSWMDAMNGAKTCRVGGYDDWRAPTIKELYSLIQFTGQCMAATGSKPFLDTKYFGFVYGDPARGERMIDCQDWSATEYVETTMNGNATVFGVNFADGRIKGYPKSDPRTAVPINCLSATFAGIPPTGAMIFTIMGMARSATAQPG